MAKETPRKRVSKYATEEEKRQAYLESQKRYNAKRAGKATADKSKLGTKVDLGDGWEIRYGKKRTTYYKDGKFVSKSAIKNRAAVELEERQSIKAVKETLSNLRAEKKKVKQRQSESKYNVGFSKDPLVRDEQVLKQSRDAASMEYRNRLNATKDFFDETITFMGTRGGFTKEEQAKMRDAVDGMRVYMNKEDSSRFWTIYNEISSSVAKPNMQRYSYGSQDLPKIREMFEVALGKNYVITNLGFMYEK